MRTLTYYVAVSLDGFIAGPADEVDAFPLEGDHIDMIIDEFRDALPTVAHDALGISPDNERFDTILMGWETYLAGLPAGAKNPFQHLRQFIFSRTRTETASPDLQPVNEDPLEVVRRLKQEPTGSGIWLSGGSNLAGQLLEEIDELIFKVNPILLGSGKPLFGGRPYQVDHFELVSSRPFTSGVVVNHYRRRT